MASISPSKTPQFDALLDEILAQVKPHTRECAQKNISKYCEGEFAILEADITFYKMLRVPPPSCCPTCRHQRRLTFTNYTRMFRRKCQAPEHTESIVSIVPPIVPVSIYDFDYYHSDQWDARTFGMKYERGKNFFDQYRKVWLSAPHAGVRHGLECENSEYTFYGRYLKNSYYVFGGYSSEDVLYSGGIFDSHAVVDSFDSTKNDTVYENIVTENCYKVFWGYFSKDCLESAFIYDCKNCSHCFGCVNLRNKSYCFFNEQLTKEDYILKRKEYDLSKKSVVEECNKKFWELVSCNPIRANRIENSINVVGNDIKNSKNIYKGIQIDECIELRYGHFLKKMKNCMDNTYGSNSEFLYETCGVGTQSSNVKFSLGGKSNNNCEYIISCSNCHDCFGCFGLKNVSYAIFNYVYEKEEYYRLLDEIKCTLLQSRHYGEMFDISFSDFTYNTSVANIVYPLTKEEINRLGYLYQPDIEINTENIELVSPNDIPDSVQEAGSSLLEKALLSEKSNLPFRIIEKEFNFHKINNLALPTETPYERMMRRFNILGNFRSYNSKCSLCGINIETTYPEAKNSLLYCTSCFQREVV